MGKLIVARVLSFLCFAALILFSQSDLFLPFGFFALFAIMAFAIYLEKEYTEFKQPSLKGFIVTVMVVLVLFRVNSSIATDILAIIATDKIVIAGLFAGYILYSYLDIKEKLIKSAR